MGECARLVDKESASSSESLFQFSFATEWGDGTIDPVDFASPFNSFFLAGFESATHRRRDGVRVDAMAAAGHDRHAHADYDLARSVGLRSARDSLRWHLIETSPGEYDWSSWLPMLRAARDAGVQVVWDLWHYGTPDWLDIFSPAFVDRLGAFAQAAARIHREETDEAPLWCPLNEISFFSFIAGEAADFHPYATGRAAELKRQLARAGIVAADRLAQVDARCRLIWCEPAVHVLPDDYSPHAIAEAEGWRLSQFEAMDMLAGLREPELGGHPGILDIVGVNFYPNNQWVLNSGSVPLGDHSWRPFSDILDEYWKRYGRPLVVAETGAEGSGRASWFHYVCGEVSAARGRGVPVQGLCLYPVTEYLGWDNDRHCPTGIFSLADERGRRRIDPRMLTELRRQQQAFGETTARA